MGRKVPNIARSIHDLLRLYWSLTGSLEKNDIEWLVDHKPTAKVNNPTLYIQKGRTLTSDLGVPRGVCTYVRQEVYITPFMPPTVSGSTDDAWDMREEVRNIIRTYRTSASGVEFISLARRSPRSGNLQDPYRGQETVIECFWRET